MADTNDGRLDELERWRKTVELDMGNFSEEVSGMKDAMEEATRTQHGSMSLLRKDLIEERQAERAFILQQQLQEAELAIKQGKAQSTNAIKVSEASTIAMTARMKQLGMLITALASAAAVAGGGYYAGQPAPTPAPTTQAP